MNAITRIRDLIGGILFWMVVLGGMAPAHAAITIGDLAYLDASIIEVSQGQLMFNRRTGEYTLTLTLRNVSGSAIPASNGMVFLAIENLTPSVASITNNPGTSSEGLPYYEISANNLMPGGSVVVVVSFINPSRQRYSFNANSYIQQGPVNRRPVANAGADISTVLGSEVKLDATGSYDPDGDLVTLHWTLVSAPENSVATLTDESSINPLLAPDLVGEYLFELIANDGQVDSEPDTVTVTVFDTVSPPNARAGPDQHVLTGSLVSLDGSASDDPNDLPLSFAWSVSEVPTGSLVTDADIWFPDPSRAEFIPDVDGRYLFNLRVDNAILIDDDSVQVFASGSNVPPTADAGPEKAARTQEVVTLDGSGSFDPDDGPQSLSHSWSLVARPPGSSLTSNDIGNANTPTPTLTPDVVGPYIARLRVSDGAATDEDNILAYGDNGYPKISIDSPADGSVVTTPRPDFKVYFSDGADESGIQPESFSAELDGVNITKHFTVTSSWASYVPGTDLDAGEKTVNVSIADLAGNVAIDMSTFEIAYLRAIPGVNVSTGKAPLTVFFTTDGEDPVGTIEVFRWDFDGDGLWDTYDTVARDYTHTYHQSGTYNATLLVQSSTGKTASASLTITVDNSPPVATANVQPSNGAVPLTVQLLGTGSDPDGSVVLYEWDYQGDGTYDWSSTTTGNTSYTYTQEGTYQAVFRVTDNDGLSTTTSVQTTAVRVGPPGSPSVTAQATPTNGDAPLIVQFSGTATDSDNDIVLYEWDFDGDGTYDWSSSTSPQVSYTYNATGDFLPTLRVTDATGLTGVDPILITVGIQVSLSVERDTVGFPGDIDVNAVTASASSNYEGYDYTRYLIDGDIYNWWYSNSGDTPAAGQNTWVEVKFIKPQRVTGVTLHWGYEEYGEQYCCGTDTCGTFCYEQYYWCDFVDCYSTYIDPTYGSSWCDSYGCYQCSGSDCPRPPEESCNDGSAYCYNYCYDTCGCTQYCYHPVYYGFTAARIDVFDTAGNLLHSQQETFPGDLANIVSTVSLPSIENATRVRITGLASTGAEYTAIAEVDVAHTPMPEPEPQPDELIGGNVNTTLSAPSPVTIQILDAEGNVARTLVNNESRSGGNYADYWDTRDDRGVIVNDGVYYAVMHYVADGKQQTLDLTSTTGGQRYDFPFGTGCNARKSFDGNVRPFEDKQMAMEFTLCSAQEVTAFIGPLWSGADETRLRTIANRQVFPAGNHTIYWDGLDDAGNIAQAPPGDDLITGFWRYSLPANAMVMTGGRPVITGVVATPNYFSPFSEECRADGYGAGVTLTYNLSEPAQSIELRVYSIATSALLRRQTLGSIPAGESAVFWDGKNNQREYVDIGDYQVGLVATDNEGNASMLRYTLVRIDY